MSTAVAVNWQTQAACSTADPDLFFPDADTPAERIEEAKRICDGCPVKQTCLEDAIKRGETEGICGGLTHAERNRLVYQGAPEAPSGRRPGKTSARQIAVQHGTYLMIALVEWRVPVEQVARDLGSTPIAVYRAYRLLVPPRGGRARSGRTSVIEELLRTSSEQLKALERRGLSHSEIGVVLQVSQSHVSAALAILRQRAEGMRSLSRDGAVDALERLRIEETRVLLESGTPLGVQEVLPMCGDTILRMHQVEGIPLRHVAAELGLCREVVRKVYLHLTTDGGVVRTLTRNEIGEAA